MKSRQPRLAESEDDLYREVIAASQHLQVVVRVQGIGQVRINQDPVTEWGHTKFEIVDDYGFQPTFRPATEFEISEFAKCMQLDMVRVVERSKCGFYWGNGRDVKVLHEGRGMKFKSVEEFIETGFDGVIPEAPI